VTKKKNDNIDASSVNAAVVTHPTRLSQGCVVVLGKTNMFRYNDPTEAASMRLTMSLTPNRWDFLNLENKIYLKSSRMLPFHLTWF
jgi:hypothetical protein